MVGKISTGNFFCGAVEYARDKNKSVKIDSNMMSESSKDLTKEFLLCANLNTRVKKKVKHFVISFSAEDGKKLNPEILRNITQEYLQKMDFKNNQYVAYLHNDTDKKHLHIIANRVDFDGKIVKDSFDKKKSRASLMELEQKYNLTRTPGQSLDKSKSFNKDEKEMTKRLNDKKKLTEKQELNNHIVEALRDDKAKDKKEFEKLLNKKNIELITNKAGNGYNFVFKDKRYKASSVNRDLSFAKINQVLKENTLIFERDQKLEQRNNSISL